MQAACSGDDAAFEQLVKRHETPLYRFLVARLGNPADAQDGLQEAFVAAWRYRQTYRPRWRFSTWLYRIALRRSAALKNPPTVNVSPAELDRPAPVAPDRDTDIWDRARHHLSAGSFTVVWLCYHEQWPLAEIASCLGRPVSWVKVTLHRARKRLALVLENTLDSADEGSGD